MQDRGSYDTLPLTPPPTHTQEEARSECHRLEAELESKEGQLADKQRALEREKEIADHYQLMINYGESEENRGLGEQQKLRLDLVQAQVGEGVGLARGTRGAADTQAGPTTFTGGV